MKFFWGSLIAFLAMCLIGLGPIQAELSSNKTLFNVSQPPTQTRGLTPSTFNPNIIKAPVRGLTLPITPEAICNPNPAEVPERTVSALCRSAMKCIVFPGGRTIDQAAIDYMADQCIRDISEGEARQLWNNLGQEPENTFTTSQLRNEILAGRATVNTTSFCSCRAAIYALDCEAIDAALNGPGDYANFQNLIPETPACGSVFGH